MQTIYMKEPTIQIHIRIQYKQQHITISSVDIFVLTAVIIHCHYCTCKPDVLTLYSLELMSAWGERFIVETCRRLNVYGRFVILYKFCALVHVKGGLFDKDYIFGKNGPHVSAYTAIIRYPLIKALRNNRVYSVKAFHVRHHYTLIEG